MGTTHGVHARVFACVKIPLVFALGKGAAHGATFTCSLLGLTATMLAAALVFVIKPPSWWV